VEFDLNFQFIN